MPAPSSDRTTGADRALKTIGFAGALLAAACGEAQAQSPCPSSPLPAGEIDIPSGPYSSWSDETRRAALFTANRRCLRCLIPSMTIFDNYKGSQEAASQFMQAVAANCMAVQMPPDWPQQAGLREKFSFHSENARRLDPNLPSPDQICSKLKP